MLDIRLYARMAEFVAHLQSEGDVGASKASFEWAKSESGLADDDLDYFLTGVGRLMLHPKGAEWDDEEERPDLDRLIWTFHRVWIDRNGWVAAAGPPEVEQ